MTLESNVGVSDASYIRCAPASRALKCIAALICLVGCGAEGMALYPVAGTVTYRGKPAGGADVAFIAAGELAGKPGLPVPQATTDDQGRFKLQSYAPDDGAPAGEYGVIVVWNEVARAADNPEAAIQLDRLQGRYAEAESSGLSATVRPGENQLPAFELK